MKNKHETSWKAFEIDLKPFLTSGPCTRTQQFHYTTTNNNLAVASNVASFSPSRIPVLVVDFAVV